jgi:hypothetical protein
MTPKFNGNSAGAQELSDERKNGLGVERAEEELDQSFSLLSPPLPVSLFAHGVNAY